MLDSDEVTAFSWRDGSVYLTRGLVDRCTDEELAAAVAHELGHLLGDGHLPPVAGLRGCDHDLDEEERADRVGVELLCAGGLPPGTMASMLKTVMESGESRSFCRESLARRIRVVEDQVGLPSPAPAARPQHAAAAGLRHHSGPATRTPTRRPGP